MTDPLQAQQLFHKVLHVAALSTMSTLRPCITSGDDHCPPAAATALPTLNDQVSLYPQEEKDKADKDTEIESVDFDLSLQCLSPEGSPGSSLADETETLTAAQVSRAFFFFSEKSAVDSMLINTFPATDLLPATRERNSLGQGVDG